MKTGQRAGPYFDEFADVRLESMGTGVNPGSEDEANRFNLRVWDGDRFILESQDPDYLGNAEYLSAFGFAIEPAEKISGKQSPLYRAAAENGRFFVKRKQGLNAFAG